MKSSMVELIVLLALALGCIPGACGVSSSFGYQNGDSPKIGYASTSYADSSVNEIMVANSGKLDLTASGYGDYSFSKSVANAEGDYVLTTAYIKGSSASWSHHYYPCVYSDHVIASEDLTASHANSIFVSSNSWNREGDDGYASTYVADNAHLSRASLSNYWNVGVAYANAAFAAQGFDRAQGDYVDAMTLGFAGSLTAETEINAGDVTKTYTAANMPIVGNYASFGMAAYNEAAVSLLPQGFIQGLGRDTTGRTGSQGTATATSQNGYAAGTSSVTASIPDLGGLTLTTNPTVWPTMAFAGRDFTLSMLEAMATGTQSRIQAYAAPAADDKSSASGSFDYFGVGFTGTTASSNVAVASKIPI